MKELPTDACYAILGANWSFTEVHRFAKAHKSRGGTVVQLVHDLIPHRHGQFVDESTRMVFRRWLDSALDYSTVLACNSQWTAQDLRDYARQDAGRQRAPDDAMPVVPLAHEFIGMAPDAQHGPDSEQVRDLCARPFVLCVGTLEPRKNGEVLLDAWKALRHRRGPAVPHLVFAGKKGWKVDGLLERLDGDAELKALVHVLDSPSDRDLACLYQQCLFTVFPSHAEGWGLPVGESAWFGKYCIASSATSIPEVCGEFADYVAPDDRPGWLQAIQRAIDEPDFVAARAARLRTMPLRRWSDVADRLWDVAAA